MRPSELHWTQWGGGTHALWSLRGPAGKVAEIERVTTPARHYFAVRIKLEGVLRDVDLPTRLWRRKTPLKAVQEWVEGALATYRPAPRLPRINNDIAEERTEAHGVEVPRAAK